MKIRSLAFILCLLTVQLSFAGFNSNLIEKRWKIKVHTKKNKPVVHHENDFLQFNTSSFFEQVSEDNYMIGSWSFNKETNILSFKTEKVTEEWTVTELSAQTLKVTNKNETLELEAVTLKFCVSGDPYAEHTIICGKWKVANHIAHYSQVAYNLYDYIQFFDDGTVEEVFKGKYKKMTWSYEQGKLTISNVTWTINDLEPKLLKADITSKNEKIVLKKI